jgi:hypothetical protein
MSYSSGEGAELLAALRAPDERSLIFNPLGIGGRLEPADAALFSARLIERATLHADVPDDVRQNFGRLRTLFRHGVLEYEFFTAADDAAHLVLEGALRHRFVTHYGHQVPVLVDGVPSAVPAPNFDTFRKRVLAMRAASQQLRLNEPPGAEALPLRMSQLWQWAQRRRLLAGQRNARVFEVITEMRHGAAHPERYSLVMPPDAFRTLRDTAEIINRLWGRDTEGGRLFPAPAPRRYRCAAINGDGTHAMTFVSLPLVPLETDTSGWTYAVYLASDSEDLTSWDGSGRQRFAHEPGFQLTALPVELAWGPDSHAELVPHLPSFVVDDPVDQVEYLDRVFFIRAFGDEVELPRSASDVISFLPASEEAVWHVVRADYPADAFVFVRDRHDERPDVQANVGLMKRLIGDDAARRAAFAVRRDEQR